MKPQRTARYFYLKFLRLRDEPVILARGVALGVFIGITPTLPFHTVLIIFCAWLIRANLIAALIAAAAVSNPLTFVPQYYAAWLVGDWLIPGKLSWSRITSVLDTITHDAGFQESIMAITHLSRDAIFTMIVGGVVIALPLSLLSYFLSLQFFTRLSRKRREKHILK